MEGEELPGKERVVNIGESRGTHVEEEIAQLGRVELGV